MRLRILLEPRNGATYQQILAMAQAAEETGFDGFFRGDHYLGIDSTDASYAPAQAQQRAGALGDAGARLLRLGVTGTPADVLRRIDELAAAGADTLYFHIYDTDPGHIRLLGTEVLPKVGG